MTRSFKDLALISGAALGLVSACGGVKTPHVDSDPLVVAASPSASETLAAIRGKKVREVTLLVFRSDLSREEWKSVFVATDELSLLRTAIGATKGRELDPEAQSALDAKVLRAGEVLGNLYDDYAAYLFSWAESENCDVTADSRFVCSPLYDIYGPNPLSGGNPVAERAFSIARGPDEKNDSLRLTLASVGPDYGDFSMELWMKPERAANETYLKGDVRVSDESRFLKDGVPAPHFRYGYAEIRFE